MHSGSDHRGERQSKSPWDLFHARYLLCWETSGLPGGAQCGLALLVFPEALPELCLRGHLQPLPCWDQVWGEGGSSPFPGVSTPSGHGSTWGHGCRMTPCTVNPHVCSSLKGQASGSAGCSWVPPAGAFLFGSWLLDADEPRLSAAAPSFLDRTAAHGQPAQFLWGQRKVLEIVLPPYQCEGQSSGPAC